MLYLPITRSWIVSRTARRRYFLCALAPFALLGTVFAGLMAVGRSGTEPFAAVQSALTMMYILLWPAILGTALLWVAMWYFWFNFDNSEWLRKTAWFFFLFLLAPVSPAFYFFFVYRRSQTVKEC